MSKRLGLVLLPLLFALRAAAAPPRDFYASFSDNVLTSESRFLQSANQVCSFDGCGAQQSDSWLVRSQLTALSRAAERTLDELYAIRSLGQSLLRPPTDARTAAMSAVSGAVVLFVDGLHAKQTWAGYTFAVDLASGRRLRSDSAARLASIELGRQGRPFALTAGWGRQAPVFGLRCALRY